MGSKKSRNIGIKKKGLFKTDLSGNRASRRAEEAYVRGTASRDRKRRAEEVHKDQAKAIQKRVERRVKRAQMRREDRELAKKTGKPVEYRVK